MGTKLKFQLGQCVQTQGVARASEQDTSFANEIQKAFTKYISGDWGDTCEEDKQLNEQAILDNERILAKYCTSKGDVFIITEWDRSYTTILFANEY